MKIYLASRYARREELCYYRKLLEAAGHEVTSRWLDSTPLEEQELSEGIESKIRHFLSEDISDIKFSDLVVCFTEYPSDSYSRGGRHVEFGLALAWGKRLAVVGPLENLFYYHPNVVQVSHIEALIPLIGG